jgi:hypothetical protein
MHHLGVLSDPPQHLGCTRALTVIESSCNIVGRLVLCQVMFACFDDYTRLLCLGLGELANSGDLHRQFFERKVLARRQASPKRYYAWCAEVLGSVLERIALAYLSLMAEVVFTA